MKICPVCASTLFDDMSTCFGCLYQFGSNPALEEQRSLDMAGQVGSDEAPASQWASLITKEEVAIPLASPINEAEEQRLEPATEPGGSVRGPGQGEGETGGPGGSPHEVELPGWVVRVRAEGPGVAQTSLTIEIEPTCKQGGS